MLRLIAPVVASLRRRRLIHMPPACCAHQAQTARDERLVASGLCRTLDRAAQLGLWEHAQRVAATAGRLAHRSAELSLRLARLKIINGESECALTILESCTERSADLDLLRVLCTLDTGRTRDAHLDLVQWQRRHPVCSQSRLLLGLLEWNIGDAQVAVSTLIAGGVRSPDIHILQALTAICTSIGRTDLARIWTRRLRRLAPQSGSFDDAALLWAMSGAHEPQAWLTLTVDRLIHEQLPQFVPPVPVSTGLELKGDWHGELEANHPLRFAAESRIAGWGGQSREHRQAA